MNDLVGQRATQEDRTEVVLIYDLCPGYIYGHGKKNWDKATQEDRTELVLIYDLCPGYIYGHGKKNCGTKRRKKTEQKQFLFITTAQTFSTQRHRICSRWAFHSQLS